MDRNKTILILAAAWVSAGLLAWFVYATAVAPKSEPQTRVTVAARDMAMGTLLRKADVKLVDIPTRSVPRAAVTQIKDATDRVLLAAISTNEPILANRLSAQYASEGMASAIRSGFRAVSVQITDVSGVAGLIPAAIGPIGAGGRRRCANTALTGGHAAA